MQVSVEELGGLERQMTVQVPAEEIDKEVQNRLISLSRKARIDGFRPGKVPVKVVKRMYGAQVRQEVLSEVLQNSLQNAILQEKLRPAGMPKVEPISFEEGVNLEYKATFEVFPEFDPQTIDGLTISYPVVEITDGDVDKMFNTLREQRVSWDDVNRPAQLRDRVTITFEGKLNGEDFSGNRGERVPLVLGSGAMIPGFEDQLLGLQSGDKVEFDVTFPENYPAENLAGQPVHFAAEIDSVSEPVLPEVDNTFAESFGIKEGGADGLRKAVKENMQRELEERIKANVKQQVMQKLLEVNDFPVPQSLIDSEIENLAKQTNFTDRENSSSESNETKVKLFGEEARRRVTLGLLIAKLSSVNRMEVDENRIQTQLEKMAASYEDSEGFVRWYHQNPQAMQNIRTLVLEDQVVEWLLERSNKVDKAQSFDEIMNAKPSLDETSQGA